MTDDDKFVRVATTREQAHEAVMLVYAAAKAVLLNGKRVRITVEEHHDDITARQRGFFHGPLLGQISEQVRIEGQRYTQPVWKEFFRQMFIPDRWEMRKQPRWNSKTQRMVTPKRATPQRVRRSTEDLGIRGYSNLIDQVIAHATTEWAVVFVFDPIERDRVRCKPKIKAATTKENCNVYD